MSPTEYVGSLAAAGAMALFGVSNAAAATTVVVTPTNQRVEHGRHAARWDGQLRVRSHLALPGRRPRADDRPDHDREGAVPTRCQRPAGIGDGARLLDQAGERTAVRRPLLPARDVPERGPHLDHLPGFTTLVFEPIYLQQGPIVPGVWQQWDVAAGLFWSTHVTCSNGVAVGTLGGPATYTLDMIRSLCPDAVVGGFGINIGTFIPATSCALTGSTSTGPSTTSSSPTPRARRTSARTAAGATSPTTTATPSRTRASACPSLTTRVTRPALSRGAPGNRGLFAFRC